MIGPEIIDAFLAIFPEFEFFGDTGSPSAFIVKHKNGAGALLVDRAEGRWQISGIWPRWNNQTFEPSPSPDAISVSASRPLHAIRMDVKRRLLDAYLQEYPNQIARMEQARAKEENLQHIKIHVCTMLDCQPPSDTNRFQFNAYRYGIDRVRINSEGKIAIETASLPVGVLEEIVAVLKKHLPRNRLSHGENK